MKFSGILLIAAIILCSKSALLGQRYWWTDGQEIATDYNTCLQGVKDTLGNWVIPPQYEYIQNESGRYIVAAGGKYGVLSRKGQVLIPMSYDYITGTDDWYFSTQLYDCYYVVLNGHTGVVDTSNRVIVPPVYEHVRGYSDSTFVAQKSKRTYDFYNYAGSKFPCPWKSKSYPDHENDKNFVMHRRTLRDKKYGLLNDSGEVVLQRKYDEVYGFDETDVFQVAKGKKYGYCTGAGKWLWPMVFETPEGYRYNIQSYVAEKGIGPAFKDGKAGLISITGEIILPFEYDRISPFDDYYDPKLWEVTKGNLSGIYEVNKGWLLQPTCTEMINTHSFLNLKDSSVTSLLIAHMNNKWGAMTSSGQVIIPFECENMLSLSQQQSIFQKRDSLLALYISPWNANYQLRQLVFPKTPIIFWFDGEFDDMQSTNIAENNQFNLFRGKNGVRAYYNPAATVDSSFIDSAGVNHLNGTWYGMSVPDTIAAAAAFAVIPLAHPIEDFEKFDLYGRTNLMATDSSYSYIEFVVMRNEEQPRLMSLRSRTYDSGSTYYITGEEDLIKSDGQVLLSGDSLSELEMKNHYHDGSLYFRHYSYFPEYNMCAYDTNGRVIRTRSKLSFEEFTDEYTWMNIPEGKYGQSQLVDNKTGLNLLGKKVYSEDAYPIWDSITIVETKKNGMRLFNIDRQKYFTTYGYDEIVPLNKQGTLFAVRTCSRNIGLVDASGKVLLDTVYTAVTTADTKEYLWNSSGHRREFFSFFYNHIVFYNDSGSVLFQPENAKIIEHRDAVPLLWKITAHSVQGDSLEYVLNDSLHIYANGQSHINLFMSVEDSLKMSHWQQQALIDSLYTPVRSIENYWGNSAQNCVYCKKGKTWSYGRPWTVHRGEGYYFLVGYRSDSLLCFSEFNMSSYAPVPVKENFSTVMLFQDGVHQMTLDSLFNPATDWRNYVINTLINYVNSHTGIEGDCHNPAGIPAMLNETFEIKPEGILLYPHGFEENSAQLVLTIPWAEADPYLRNDIKSRLPIPKK